MKFWKKIAACGLSVALAVGTASCLQGAAGAKKTPPLACKWISILASNLFLDADNKVLSVTALNDDGSLIIAGEAFVWKNRGGSRGNDGKHFYRCGVSR